MLVSDRSTKRTMDRLVSDRSTKRTMDVLVSDHSTQRTTDRRTVKFYRLNGTETERNVNVILSHTVCDILALFPGRPSTHVFINTDGLGMRLVL